MTTIRDFMDDLIFWLGRIAAFTAASIIEWYQSATVELIVCWAAGLFVAAVFISMWV